MDVNIVKVDMHDDIFRQKIVAAQEQGKTVSYIGIDDKVLGYVSISDSIKSSSPMLFFAYQ
jgi:cation transport ATPase